MHALGEQENQPIIKLRDPPLTIPAIFFAFSKRSVAQVKIHTNRNNNNAQVSLSLPPQSHHEIMHACSYDAQSTYVYAAQQAPTH